jgi:hypothetical protein
MKKVVYYLIILVSLFYAGGCYSLNVVIDSDELKQLSGEEKIRIKTNDEKEYNIDLWDTFGDTLLFEAVEKSSDQSNLTSVYGDVTIIKENRIPFSEISGICKEGIDRVGISVLVLVISGMLVILASQL